MTQATVAAGLARGLFDLAARRGVAPPALLDAAGVAAAALEDPDGRITLDRYVALMRAAAALSGDPAMALRFGESVDLAEFSVVGSLAPPSGLAHDGLAVANRFAPLLLDDSAPGAARFALEERGDDLWLVDRRPDPNGSPELTESTFARIVMTLRRAGCGDVVREVRVTHPRPGHAAEYARVFRVPIAFGGAQNELRIDRALFGAAAASPRYGYSLLRDHAEALLAKLERERTVRVEVERLLLAALPDQPSGIDAVANRLGVGRQTLQRRLKRENTTFSAVRDAVRHRLALRYLDDASASVAHVAWLLGFADRAAFTRAFQRWTGSGPSAWRRQVL